MTQTDMMLMNRNLSDIVKLEPEILIQEMSSAVPCWNLILLSKGLLNKSKVVQTRLIRILLCKARYDTGGKWI